MNLFKNIKLISPLLLTYFAYGCAGEQPGSELAAGGTSGTEQKLKIIVLPSDTKVKLDIKPISDELTLSELKITSYKQQGLSSSKETIKQDSTSGFYTLTGKDNAVPSFEISFEVKINDKVCTATNQPFTPGLEEEIFCIQKTAATAPASAPTTDTGLTEFSKKCTDHGATMDGNICSMAAKDTINSITFDYKKNYGSTNKYKTIDNLGMFRKLQIACQDNERELSDLQSVCECEAGNFNLWEKANNFRIANTSASEVCSNDSGSNSDSDDEDIELEDEAHSDNRNLCTFDFQLRDLSNGISESDRDLCMCYDAFGRESETSLKRSTKDFIAACLPDVSNNSMTNGECSTFKLGQGDEGCNKCPSEADENTVLEIDSGEKIDAYLIRCYLGE